MSESIHKEPMENSIECAVQCMVCLKLVDDYHACDECCDRYICNACYDYHTINRSGKIIMCYQCNEIFCNDCDAFTIDYDDFRYSCMRRCDTCLYIICRRHAVNKPHDNIDHWYCEEHVKT